MSDSSTNEDDTRQSEEAVGVDRHERPKHANVQPWLDEDSPPEADDDEPDPPPLLDAVGDFGIYLALASLGLALIGLPALYVGFQPLANIAIVLALLGVTVSMFLGMAFQAYMSDFSLPGS